MSDRRWRIAGWVAVSAVVCLAAALKDTAAASIEAGIERRYLGATLTEHEAWTVTFNLMWAALTPLIFASARRVPFTRHRWGPPLAFHAAAGIVVSAVVPAVLCFLVFDPLWRGIWWDTVPWLQIAGLGAVSYSMLYWMILAAGFALAAYDDNRERERNAAELQRALVGAQVEALKMKLQPHFLFNTLNSISFLAVEKDVAGVVSMVERLATLLRSSMQVSASHLVPVREELALADQYLAIEEIRFADRLRVARRVAPGALDALVPSLVLQPIIENSIKHGFSRRIDASRIEIAIRRDGDSLVVTVEDDGPGVPPGWTLSTNCGRGLKNVIERLEKLYPGEWAFSLRNLPRGGAVSRLRIPWQEHPVRAADWQPAPGIPAVSG